MLATLILHQSVFNKLPSFFQLLETEPLFMLDTWYLSNPLPPPPPSHPANRSPWWAADHHGSSCWRFRWVFFSQWTVRLFLLGFRFNPDYLARIQSDTHPEVFASVLPETSQVSAGGRVWSHSAACWTWKQMAPNSRLIRTIMKWICFKLSKLSVLNRTNNNSLFLKCSSG